MNASEYYSLPLHTADSLEFERFMMADHFNGDYRLNRDKKIQEPLSLEEFMMQAIFAMLYDET